MSSNTNGKRDGIGFASLLFLVFLVLKLTYVIDWSWWWITAPLWGPFVIVVVIMGIVVAVAATRSRKKADR